MYETDKFIRTMDWRGVAEQEWALLEPSTRDALTSYAAGVNAYIADRKPSELAAEYAILGLGGLDYTPEEWEPVDSLAWLKAMAWDLRANYRDELARARLSGRLTPAQISELYPAFDYDARPPILSAQEWSPTGPDRPDRSAVPSALTVEDQLAPAAPASAAPAPGSPRRRRRAAP